jgi:hypothetical protein
MWIESELFPSVKKSNKEEQRPGGVPLVRANNFPHSVIPCPKARLPFPKETNPMLAYDG